jgi:thiosulfate/3-mercaptopyruvate sulfurtransferase
MRDRCALADLDCNANGALLMKANLPNLELLMFMILSTLSLGPLSAAPASSPPESQVTDAAGPLMDASGLQAIACEPGVVVLDIRSEKIDGQSSADYARGHIPCAIHSDYADGGWRAKVDGVPGMLPSVQQLEALIGGLGIENDTQVVVAPLGTDSKSMAGAARVYWTFKVLGHDRVSILDGGTGGYAADPSRPLEQGERTPEPRTYKAHLRPEMLVSEQELARAAQTERLLVDYRRQDEFSGLNRNAKTVRAGTLASARNIPLEWLTRDNGGYLRSSQALEQVFRLADVPLDAEQIAFCNTGHNSSLGWFVAHEIFGNEAVRLYDGSMAQWSRNAALPMSRSVAVTD